MKFMTPLILVAFLLSPIEAHAQSKPRPKASPKAGAVQKKIYCWEESGGKVCGDAMPPSAANAARTEINANTGIVSRSVERVLTPEERAEIARQQKASEIQVQQQQTQDQQAQVLLMSYGSEQALNMAFDERVDAIKKTISDSNKQKQETRSVLVDRLANLTNMELMGKKPPKASIDSMNRLRAQMKEHDGILRGHLQQIQQIEAERQQSLALYRGGLQGLAPATTAQLPPSP